MFALNRYFVIDDIIYKIIKTKHILILRNHLFQIAIYFSKASCHYQDNIKIISKEENF